MGKINWRAMPAANHRDFSPLNVPALCEGGRPPLCSLNILNIIALPTQDEPDERSTSLNTTFRPHIKIQAPPVVWGVCCRASIRRSAGKRPASRIHRGDSPGTRVALLLPFDYHQRPLAPPESASRHQPDAANMPA